MEFKLTIDRPSIHERDTNISFTVDDIGIWLSCDQFDEHGEITGTHFIKDLCLKDIIALKHFVDAVFEIKITKARDITMEKMGDSLKQFNNG